MRWSSIHLNKRNIWNFVGCSLYYISIHEFGLNVTFLSGNSQQVPKVVFFLSNYWRDCVLIIDELVKHTIYQTLLILKELSEFKKFCFCPLCLCQFFGCWYWWQFCVSRQIGNSHLCKESCQHWYDRESYRMPWCIPIQDRHHLLLNSTVKCCATFLYRRRFTWFLTVNELFASDIVPVPFSSNFTVKEAEPSFKQKKYLLVMKCERKHMNYRKCKMVDLFLRQLDSCTAPEWVQERQKRKKNCKTPKKHSFDIVNRTSWSQ